MVPRHIAVLLPTLVLVVALLALPGIALAQTPGMIPVQGVLADADDMPVDGTVPAVFKLYGDAQGQMEIWSSDRQVVVDQGHFTVYLGETATLDLSIFRDYPVVWLGMAFDGDTEMPLVEVAAAPYAGYAAFSGDAATVGGLAPDALDTLSGLGCAADQVARFDGTDWACGAALQTDTTLDEAAVDAFVANNGFALSAGLALVATTGSFSDLSNIPAGLADGDNDTLGGLSCGANQVAKRIGGVWSCADDVGQDYLGSSPIQITGNNISLATGGIGATHLAPGAVTDTSVAGTANIAPGKIAGTAATLTGSQSFDGGTFYIDAASNEVGIGTTNPTAALDVRGDIAVDGAIVFPTPRAGTYQVSAMNFVTMDDNEDDLFNRLSSGYLYISTAPDNLPSGYVTAPVVLPSGARITGLECNMYDNNSTEDISGTAYLQERALLSTSASTRFSAPLSTTGASATIQVGADTTVTGNDIYDPTVSHWFLRVYWNPAVTGSSLRFYGCSVDYELSAWAP